jgi:hypothetical protein
VAGDVTARPRRWRLASRWSTLAAGGVLLAMIVAIVLIEALFVPRALSGGADELLFLAFGAVGVVIGNPARRRVQRVVDRRFNRARYDADRMAASFAARLADATGLEGVRGDLLGTVGQALEPAHACVWLGGGQP